ncbi:MAG: DUF5010 domain-containing protein [Armatimonadota bacterium]
MIYKSFLIFILLLIATQTMAGNLLDPPGPYAKPVDPKLIDKITFSSRQPVTATYFFYWFDSYTNEGFILKDGKDAQTDHPSNPDGYSHKNPDWWYREMVDMTKAGIDIILPVYWGSPGSYDQWSFTGLVQLVEAQNRMLAEGKRPPKVGMIFNCAQLEDNDMHYHADLTTEKGKEFLYLCFRDYYSMIPPSMWACIDGKPVIWLYYSTYAKNHDDSWPDYINSSFRRDFGVEPFIVRETTWKGNTDALYLWSASIAPSDLGVIGVGPGFDARSVKGGKLLRERDGGKFYERSWKWALSKPAQIRSKILVVETWNELHEGTDICDTKEYGRKYIEMTRHYADLFHANKTLPDHLRHTASIRLGAKNICDGLVQNDIPDALTEPVVIKGVPARRTIPNKYLGRYMMFNADDFMLRGKGIVMEMKVTYLDNSTGRFTVEYDSSDFDAPFNGTFKLAGIVNKTGTGKWKNARFVLDAPALANRMHENDFRFYDESNDLVVSAVDLKVVSPRKSGVGNSKVKGK